MPWRWVCALALAALAGAAKGDAMEPTAKGWTEREYLVGVNYFCGWWRELPNKYTPGGRDWRPAYPERRALLGEFNEQATMDREIAAAADHGVDFFQILWYPMDYEGRREAHQERLNDAVEQFMASPNSHRMRFTVEFCNHYPFHVEGDDRWAAACRFFCRAMKHPSYLRVAGRPVFKVHTADQFLQQNGGDPARVRARWATLRRIAAEAGLPAPIIGTAGDPNGPTGDQYDYTATYMDVPDLPVRPEPYAYADLLKRADGLWTHYAVTLRKPYVPYLPAGWDPRPWGDPRPAFAMPDRADWLAALRQMKSALDQQPCLGIPDGRGGRRKAFTIYAWNEFGEGGIVAPTAGQRSMKLEAIREVFGRAKPYKP